ncbi:uncharacterized protein J4E87_007746 [Alternaria ethzedia]|uniref:uncharacterized protein n=1 Tax=Alternaria ethzedia TaxID=181014 RepID=UPI0020C353CB|nr:uncharacterized protein J4E87_007746 [Alternaria ethzedia]KAI4619158.1 hypothetical protein J4E87_007746 [Alternaria ethzedia]
MPATLQNTIASIRNVVGWFGEPETFRTLSSVCANGQAKFKTKIATIRGPEGGTIDGGFIVDPPSDFPAVEIRGTEHWSLEQRTNSTPLRLYRFDVKTSITRPTQWAHFYIVMMPAIPHFLCIVPLRSYQGLSWVQTRLNRTKESSQASGTWRANVSYALLAPFAVHEDDVYEAILRINTAAETKSWYTNPTNHIVFSGWHVPAPDTTVDGIFQFSRNNSDTRTSRETIQRLANFLERCPETQMSVIPNPTEPLVADFILQDHKEGVEYLIEHKTYGPTSGKSLSWCAAEELEPIYNWHFRINQLEDDLMIHTRLKADEDQATHSTPPARIKLTSTDAPEKFAKTIREYGKIAKIRIRDKWKNTTLYDDNVPDKSVPNDVIENDISEDTANTDLREFADAFSTKLNNQCWKLGQHVCIPLSDHPTADAVFIEHKWRGEDRRNFECSGILPVSLFQKSPNNERGWSYKTQWLVGNELGRDTGPLIAKPFLNSTACPDLSIFSLPGGEVHEFLCTLFEKGEFVVDLNGPTGLLQTQWNHGTSLKVERRGRNDWLMMRVLSTLPPNASSWSAAAFEKALTDAETPYAHRPLRKRRPLARRDLIEDPTYGMTIEELVALSGVVAEPGLHCDSCPDAESCKKWVPKLWEL